MSTNVSKQINCANCGGSVQTRLWPVIDVAQNPEQRERILEESLFIWQCPDCGDEMQLLYPCLYQDRKKGFLLLLEPNQAETTLEKKKIPAEHFPNTKKRIVSSPEEMKEKLLLFEADLNDAACELIKLAMGQSIAQRQGHVPTNGYFSAINREKGEITFVFRFSGAQTEPLYQTTRLAAYEKTLEITESLQFNPCADSFLRVDSDVAKQMLEAYQNQTASEE